MDAPDERTTSSPAADTWLDHLWRLFGWLAFFGLGYVGFAQSVDVPKMYPAACAYIAERKLANELLLKYAGHIIGWITRRGSL